MDKNIPLLEFAYLKDLYLHEKVDEKRVENILEKIKQDKILKSPPIVTKINKQKFVVLDGATRISALKRLGLNKVLVEVVDYLKAEVGLDSWIHLISELKEDSFIERVSKINGLKLIKTSRTKAQKLLNERRIIAYLIFKNNGILAIKGSRELYSRVELLNNIVREYGKKREIYRTKFEDVYQLLEDYEDASTAIVFPNFSKKEIIKLALNGAKLPCGITRHHIPKRILGFNLPLEELRGKDSVKEKNQEIEEKIKEKLKNKNIRFYPESVILFNE